MARLPVCRRRRLPRNAADPTQRLIYVGGQTIPSGGGAIELTLPSDAWVMYGYQWPQASQANPSTNAIIFRQNGVEVPRLTVYRTDGTNGDPNYNPLFPFKMRGGVDQYGNVITGNNVSNLTYAIDIPIVTNAPFDILARSDASAGEHLDQARWRHGFEQPDGPRSDHQRHHQFCGSPG
jgi:hypothetical protein